MVFALEPREMIVREVFDFRPIEGRPPLFEPARNLDSTSSSQLKMEVITGGGQRGVSAHRRHGVVIAAHAVLGLEMTDHWFDGGLTDLHSLPWPFQNIANWFGPLAAATYS